MFKCHQTLLCVVGGIWKRDYLALKWPAHFSNTAALVCVGLESIKAIILTLRLAFFQHLFSKELICVGAATIRSLLDDLNYICIVRECRGLFWDPIQ